MCQKNPKSFLPHPILPSTLSLNPQPGSTSMSKDILHLSTDHPLQWHACLPRGIPSDSICRGWGVPSSSWCKTLQYSTSTKRGRSAGVPRGWQTPQS